MINDEKKFELIKFEDGEFSLDVNVSPDEDTVWLTANEIALLFERDEKTIRNILIMSLKKTKLITITIRIFCVLLVLNKKLLFIHYI